MRNLLLFLSSILLLTDAYKLAIFAPDISSSQVIWNKRVAEALVTAGHDVTIILISSVDDMDNSRVKIDPKVKLYKLNSSIGVTMDEVMVEQQMIFEDTSMMDSRNRQRLQKMMKMLQQTCANTVKNKEFLTWLEKEKFDLAFSHMYDMCPIGVIHHVKIPTWIWLNSGGLMDFVAEHMGVPIIPSYVPPMMMEAKDKMNFIERTKSFIGHTLSSLLFKSMASDPITAIFRKQFGSNFPDLLDLAHRCPLVMVNSNQLYELPRPTLAKIINIGGLGATMKDAQPLPENFQKIVNTGKGVVVMSFGSVAPAHSMPDAWKQMFMKTFARFPDYQFVMRYEKTDMEDFRPSNVHLFKWLPQTDLLQNPRTKLFITHGGYNSLQEAISAGIPIIPIALFGDQFKNSQIAEKHGFARVIKKADLSEKLLEEAIRTVLTEQSYRQKVVRLRDMVRVQPIAADQLLVRWTEFLAQFQTLDNMEPAAVHLNFWQYHSLDVIGFLLSIVVVVLFVVVKLIRCLVRKCCCGGGNKKKLE